MVGRRPIKVILSILAVFFLLLFGRCMLSIPDEPPVWIVDLVIPLINETFTMEKIKEEFEVDELTMDYIEDQVILTIEDESDLDFSRLLQVDIPQIDDDAACNAVTAGRVIINTGDIIGVQEAVVDEGFIVIRIDNQHPYDLDVIFEVIDLFHPITGEPFRRSMRINAFNYYDSPEFDISGYRIVPFIENDQSYIRYRVTELNGDTGDGFPVVADFMDMAYRSITGEFNEVEASFDDVEIENPIPDELKEVRVESAELTLTFLAGVQLPIEISFEVSGENFEGTPAAPIRIDTTLTAWDGIGEVPSYTFKRDVADFINGMPEVINFEGSGKLGVGGVQATVSINDPITGIVNMRVPLTLTLPTYMTKMEVDTLEFEEDTIDAIHDNLMEVGIFADIENHMPIGAELSIMFSDDRSDSTLYDFPDLIIGPISMDPATLSGNPAVVMQSAMSDWDMLLTKDEHLRLFENETLYWGILFSFNGTQGQMAKIRPEDYVTIQAYGMVKARTKIPEDENGEGGGL